MRETPNVSQISLNILKVGYVKLESMFAKKNYLADNCKPEGLQFAREHIHYTNEFWRKMIWSDENSFNGRLFSLVGASITRWSTLTEQSRS